ncbi:hypothetical protein HF086_000324 [Spodoptera exigua]|uniref:Mutator-like transposase domain-containing protein n=1 Tax=Spodoptera exigua TaxID=7107 RepID=A0A922MY28_SPOEX|nr:hypothetical protein HF086_000324 [Spodoptera exigua]
MGKKKERCSKRKRRACLLEKCANMTKRKKQLLEQCSENETMESSTCNKNKEMTASFLGNENDALPNYAELQNVLPANADTNDTNILQNDGIPAATISSQCSSDKISTVMTIESPTEAPIEPEVQDIGHRIIDVNHFVTELIKFSEHKSLFNCGLATLKFESEHRVGLQSEFTYVCSLCGYKNKIKSSLADVNTDAVAGFMAAGCGQAQLNQFLSGVGLPNMSDFIYNKMHNDICDDWEETAWDEMKKAGDREKEAAIKEGRVNKDGIPLIDVIVDGCWCKRSYRSNYAALSGCAAIIGRRFGQVLYMCVKNKYCCICARAEKKKETPKKHDCYKNFNGASAAMESTIITEGFKQSLDMHGLIYSRFIADGDSSTYAKIINARPYPDITVTKYIVATIC